MMNTAELAALIGKTICIDDARTGAQYECTVMDAKNSWGKLRIALNGLAWFEPSQAELESIQRLND